MSKERGAGLISVMVAVAILAVTLAAATSAFLSASKLTKHAAYFSKASSFAEGVMERETAMSYSRLESRNVAAPAALPEAKCIVAVAARSAGVKEVTITCAWTEGSKPYRVRFSTLVTEGGRR